MDPELVAIEHHPNRVDEKGRVVGHEHDHRSFRLPTIAFEFGRQHLHERLAALANPAEVEVGNSGGVGEFQPATSGVVVGHLAEVLADERGEERVVRSTLGGHRLQSVDDVGHVVVSTHGGPDSSRKRRCASNVAPVSVDV